MSEKSKTDEELLVMNQMRKKLESLDPNARWRVVNWLVSRFTMPATTAQIDPEHPPRPSPRG